MRNTTLPIKCSWILSLLRNQRVSSILKKLKHHGSWKPRFLGMPSFFSPLNLPIWLKGYSLLFAIGTDNIPPQMDSLKHMGNTCQTGLHLPHAAVFFSFGSPGCLQTLTSSMHPTPTPRPSKELCYCSHHHGVSLPSVSPVIRNEGFTTLWTCLPEAYTFSRSLNLKRFLIWQWWLPLICWRVFLKIQGSQEKKRRKNPIPHDFHARHRCKRILWRLIRVFPQCRQEYHVDNPSLTSAARS